MSKLQHLNEYSGILKDIHSIGLSNKGVLEIHANKSNGKRHLVSFTVNPDRSTPKEVVNSFYNDDYEVLTRLKGGAMSDYYKSMIEKAKSAVRSYIRPTLHDLMVAIKNSFEKTARGKYSIEVTAFIEGEEIESVE